MDLNYLFHRHQVSVMMAAAARGSEARMAHVQLAGRYATKIATVQAQMGADRTFVAA
ncbi:hypothetical protein [uncultured Sphingomonas sp.]|uniref:hypothetical protein n=1 Tax=uncultured Sphingomonas sp. TaxID=158754 RepID=UPI0030FC65FA